MARLIFFWAIALALISIVNATTLTRLFKNQFNSKRNLFALNKRALSPQLGPFTFPQKVDHFDWNNHATFPQRYWVNSTNYRPGGPIIFFNVGESDASGFTDYLIEGETSLLAQRLGGVVIVFEHRYYGESNPVPDLSGKNMVYLTVDQSLADMVNFMQTVEIKINGTALPPAPKTPWIPIGGSYPGALVAWLKYKHPELVFASVSSSGPVQAKYNFWEYFEPILMGADEHCRDSIINTIKYVDEILFGHNKKNIQQLKIQFGLPNVTHNDDFAAALGIPVSFWQKTEPGDPGPFEEFCQAFNNATTPSAQVAAYASWTTAYAANACQNQTQDDYFGTHDPKASKCTNTTLNNDDRSWLWQTCLEFGYWQTAAPKGHLTLISRLVTPDYFQRQCQLFFPVSILSSKPRTNYINEKFGGWKLEADHIFWINGEFDPWRSLSVAAPNAPTRLSTEKSPNVLIKDAVHVWDAFWSPTTTIPEPIVEVHNQLVASLSGWLKNFNTI